MAKLRRLSPRKEPTQERSKELCRSLLEAATYILKQEGAAGFTTNKVADRAGANIASLYQYYPNKEALLFHLIEHEWEKTYRVVFPILRDETQTRATRLRLF
ncbi:MAG: TetR/AcrR family transcriptional regulator, partial [Proteobacteria bacterium]